MNASKIKKAVKNIPGIEPVWNFLSAQVLKAQNPEKVFTNIYRKNAWGDQESVSGTGSNLEQTAILRDKLGKLVEGLGVKTLLDIPCGDFHWMHEVDLGDVNYLGADIVKPLVETNTKKYASKSVKFCHMDLIKDELPKVDLIFCRDCLVHLSFDDILKALNNVVKSGSTYLLTTTFTECKRNENIVTGRWRMLNLNLEPFKLPPPLSIMNEESKEKSGEYKDKSLALWRVSDIQKALRVRKM